MTNGLMLSVILSCSCVSLPTIKEPVEMYAVNIADFRAAEGKRSFDIKGDVKKVGEWVTRPVLVNLYGVPNNLMCFKLKDWSTKIKPKMKEGSQAYHDYTSH